MKFFPRFHHSFCSYFLYFFGHLAETWSFRRKCSFILSLPVDFLHFVSHYPLILPSSYFFHLVCYHFSFHHSFILFLQRTGRFCCCFILKLSKQTKRIAAPKAPNKYSAVIVVRRNVTSKTSNHCRRSKSYTSIDPKQQQTMFPPRSCAIKNSLGAPFLKKKRKKRRETSRGTRARNQKEPENHDGTPSSSLRKKRKNSRETSPGTLAGTRRKEKIMMDHNATVLRRQAPRPFLVPDGTRTGGTECQKTRETLPGTLHGTRK